MPHAAGWFAWNSLSVLTTYTVADWPARTTMSGTGAGFIDASALGEAVTRTPEVKIMTTTTRRLTCVAARTISISWFEFAGLA